MTATLLFISSGFLTLISTAIIWRDALNTPPKQHKSATMIATLMFAAIILNLWGIHLIESISADGINFSVASGAAVSTLIVQCIYTFGVIRHGIQGLGLFLLPATAIPLFLIPVLPEAATPNWIHTSSLLETSHLLISLISYAILTLAAIHALMQIQLNNALKKKRMSPLIHSLPPLMSIEKYMMSQVKLSTALIGISILTGLSWQWVEYQHFALLNHKVLLAIFAFIVLTTLIIQRGRSCWSANVASRAVLTAYALLMLAYFGVKMIDAWIH